MSHSRLSLEHDRKRAKALLKALRSGDADALARLRLHHPRCRGADDASVAELKLADAQLVIARENGEPSWPRWKHYVELHAQQDAEAQRAALVETLLGDDPRPGLRLLTERPELAREDVWCALAAGEAEPVRQAIAQAPDWVNRPGGPLHRAPLLYATHSRLLGEADFAAHLRVVVEVLLDAGADANAAWLPEGETAPEKRRTALYGAAGKAGDAAVTALLLDAGAAPDDGTPDALGPESLYHAAEFADGEALRLLLAAGPPQAAIDYCLGRALDFLAPAPVLAFLEAGADVNTAIPWFGNRTHLHKAIQHGHAVELVARLLDAGGDPLRTDDSGRDALAYALRFGREDVVDLLAMRGVPRTGARSLDAALFAMHGGRSEGLDPATLEPADLGLLGDLARQGRHGAVRALLDAGWPVDTRGADGAMTPLLEACFAGDARMVEMLLDAGADPEAESAYGGRPLGTAIYGSLHCHDALGGPTSRPVHRTDERGYARIVERLLQLGVTPPQDLGGSDAVVTVLLAHGVSAAS